MPTTHSQQRVDTQPYIYIKDERCHHSTSRAPGEDKCLDEKQLAPAQPGHRRGAAGSGSARKFNPIFH